MDRGELSHRCDVKFRLVFSLPEHTHTHIHINALPFQNIFLYRQLESTEQLDSSSGPEMRGIPGASLR